jgi:hypothetical protein
VVFAAMIVASYHWERRRAWHDKRLPESEHSKSVDDNWIALIAILSKYVNDLTHLNLFFADLRQLRLAETVGDVFASAGWTVDLTKAPLPYDDRKYVDATRVSGYDRHLVEAVAMALSGHGFPDARAVVKDNPLDPSSPEWKQAQHRIQVIIGPR